MLSQNDLIFVIFDVKAFFSGADSGFQKGGGRVRVGTKMLCTHTVSPHFWKFWSPLKGGGDLTPGPLDPPVFFGKNMKALVLISLS